MAAVLYGGRGKDERGYRALFVDYDQASEKQHQEHAVDRLCSEFIPAGADAAGVPAAVAHRRLLLQKDGLLVVEFSTRLELAWLQIGDHIGLESRRYARSGAQSPNPLLALLTRKNIDRGLGMIHWSALVLLDAGQSAAAALAPEPPEAARVEALGGGVVQWSWTASPEDIPGAGGRYELFQRPAQLESSGLSQGDCRRRWLGRLRLHRPRVPGADRL